MFSACSCLGQNGENLRQVATIGLETRKRRTDRRYDIFFITPFVRNLQRPGTAMEYQLYRLRYLRAASIKKIKNDLPLSFFLLLFHRTEGNQTFQRSISRFSPRNPDIRSSPPIIPRYNLLNLFQANGIALNESHRVEFFVISYSNDTPSRKTWPIKAKFQHFNEPFPDLIPVISFISTYETLRSIGWFSRWNGW